MLLPKGQSFQATLISERVSKSHVHHPSILGLATVIVVVDAQQGHQDIPHNELSQGPICVEVEVVIDGRVIIYGRKKAKLTSTDEKRD